MERLPRHRTFELEEDYVNNHEHIHAAEEYSLKDLRKIASAREIKGRSKMDKPTLIAALTMQTWGAPFEKAPKKTRAHTPWDEFRVARLAQYIDAEGGGKAGFGKAMKRIGDQYKATGVAKGPRVPTGAPKGSFGKAVKEAVAKYRAAQAAGEQVAEELYGEGKAHKNRLARARAQLKALKGN
jgi:hypothetical protein